MGSLRTSGSHDPADLVRQARDGDRSAWDHLVDKYARLVWAVTRDFRLSDSDASDVAQTTWLRLLEHIDRIDPTRTAAWLTTTARRECLRVIALRKRMLLTYDDAGMEAVAGTDPGVDERLLTDEKVRDVREAMQALPDRWQELLRLSSADPPMSYAEISATLGMPIGSIGPIRGRCLAKLRALLAAR
ncbi:MAG: sigma-70 family RNA polymerase sigma factor [Streptosporangiales bacterium]|nr:sigma-70 family RNA polymerase sigma factor [Streptosporangiales bacterium]